MTTTRRYRTRKLAATDTKGARIRVTSAGVRTDKAYDYAARDPHEAALREVVNKPIMSIEVVKIWATGYTWQVVTED